MPRDYMILTEHRNEDGRQVIEKTVDFEDGPSVTFVGTPGGTFDFDGEITPPGVAVEALQDHLDEVEVAADLLKACRKRTLKPLGKASAAGPNVDARLQFPCSTTATKSAFERAR